ncbi:unnamed protein product [Trichogramma brassicae]|uniref:C2H2-type domain-containing protein n=1 Tax=Trichogramma brassicae TaxID=86971 RepID=A0A6H5IB54_9HYME|nr:unnamed protein product [Trichogramma brassicae]
MASCHIQNFLDKLQVWLQNWRIKVNGAKSSHITFTLRKNNCPQVSIYGNPIPQSDQVKYLGMHLDRRLTWKVHIWTKRKQLGLKLRKFYWLLGRKSPLTIENKVLLYKTILRPVWTYGIQLWGAAATSNLNIIERYQAKVLRSMVNAPWFVPNEIIRNDLNIPPVRVEISNLFAKYKIRLRQHINPLALELPTWPAASRLRRRKLPQELMQPNEARHAVHTRSTALNFASARSTSAQQCAGEKQLSSSIELSHSGEDSSVAPAATTIMTKTTTTTITRWRCDTMLRLRETRSCLYNRRGEFVGYIDSRDPLENLKILRKSSLRLEEVRSICSAASQRVCRAPKAIGCDHRCHVRAAQQHQLTKHDGRKDFECDKCEKKFGLRWSWLMHIKTVHQNCKDYACDKCEKKFGRKSILSLHQRTVHEGRQDFACDICQKKFGQKMQLLNHQKAVHEGRKDYACDNCEKKFGRKQQLLSHQKVVHEGRKDLACDKCGQTFGQQFVLNRHHKIVHEGRKDYTCNRSSSKCHVTVVRSSKKIQVRMMKSSDLVTNFSMSSSTKSSEEEFELIRSASPREDRIGPREQQGETKERGKNYQKKKKKLSYIIAGLARKIRATRPDV